MSLCQSSMFFFSETNPDEPAATERVFGPVDLVCDVFGAFPQPLLPLGILDPGRVVRVEAVLLGLGEEAFVLPAQLRHQLLVLALGLQLGLLFRVRELLGRIPPHLLHLAVDSLVVLRAPPARAFDLQVHVLQQSARHLLSGGRVIHPFIYSFPTNHLSKHRNLLQQHVFVECSLRQVLLVLFCQVDRRVEVAERHRQLPRLGFLLSDGGQLAQLLE